MLEFVFKIDPAVPDFARRKVHESEHVLAISGHCARGEAARPLVRHGGGLGRDGDAGRQTLEVDGEIDAGQRLIEIIDVEEDVVFGRIERAEVHQMTVAAGLHRRARKRLMREIGRHHRRRAAKKPERVHHHALVTLRHELGDPLGVGFRKNGDGVPIQGAVELRMGFARDARSQVPAVLVSLCAVLQRCGHGDALKETGPAQIQGRTARRRSTRAMRIQLDRAVGNRSCASRRSSVNRRGPKPFKTRKSGPTTSEVYRVGVKSISDGKASPITAQCPIGHTRGWMAGSSQAPVLILTAPYALAPSIAMAVRTAAA